MFFSRLLDEFPGYFEHSEYVQGVLVELTGIVIEVALLSVTIPLILHIYNHFKTRHVRAAVDFYLFQVFHGITRIFLDIADIKDVGPILAKEMEENSRFEIRSHGVYGNLENILFVLKKAHADKNSYRRSISEKSLADYQRYASTCQKCLDELDRLTVMLTSIPRVQEDLFKMRSLVYALRDFIEGAVAEMEKRDKESYRKIWRINDVERITVELTEIIEHIFSRRKKLIDSVLQHRFYLTVLRMALSLPYILIHRKVGPPLCRYLKKPYRDPVDSGNLFRDKLKEWREGRGLTYEQAAEMLGMAVKEYIEYEFGYRRDDRAIPSKMGPYFKEAFFAQSEEGDFKTKPGPN